MVKQSQKNGFMFLLILLCGISAVYGAAISGTGGTATLKDGPNAEGLYYEIDVHYQAFDGTDAGDPLGITPGEIQFAYILEYVDGNAAVDAYNIESASGVPIANVGIAPNQTSVNGVLPGTEAPLSSGGITLPSGNPGATFIYKTPFSGPSTLDTVGDKSVTLVYTASSDQNTSGAAYGIATGQSLGATGLVIGPVPQNPFKPRTPGYWKHQYSGKGRRKEADLLAGYMNDIGVYSEVFSDDLAGDLASDLAYASGVLINDDSSSMLKKAERQLFAMWLNVVSGKVSYFQEVTFDPAVFDTTATTVGEAIEQAEATILDPAATLEELENVKDMLDMVNNQ